MAFWYSFSEQQCFSVSPDDLLTEEDIYHHWDLVEASDSEEIQWFLTHGVFKHRYWTEIVQQNIIDATWVRKRKLKDGTWIVKSRLCARGFLDKQKFDILRHSSTTSRPSHKMAWSIAVNYGYDSEAWGISTAFLREVQQKAKQLGHDINVPRHV